MTLKNKTYTLNLLNLNNEINNLHFDKANKFSFPIVCVDNSNPQKCIGFSRDENFSINFKKCDTVTTIVIVIGEFTFFDNKEYELVGFEVRNEDYSLASLVFKEKEKIYGTIQYK